MVATLDMLDEGTRREVIGASSRRRYRKGEVLFHAGDPGDTLHLVAKGHVAIRLETALGDRSTLAVLGVGMSFGEQALLSRDGRRTATAEAIDAVETLSLHRNDFEALRDRNPRIDRLLVSVLAEQVRRLTDQVVSARHSSVQVRAARVIMEMIHVWDGPEKGMEIPLTQDDLAGLAGITRPTMNRALQELVDKGAISLSRGKVTILNAAMISARAR